nr:unnamed protein product [Spirometra erinaceieuropaei]
MVCQLQDGVMARVTEDGAVSKVFAMTNEVEYGCFLAPNLLSLMLSVILMDAYRDKHPGICIIYRTDGHLLDRRGCTSSGVSINLFAAAYENFGLTSNTEKTVVMRQPPPDAAYVAPHISVNESQLQVVDNFMHLGSTISRSTKIDNEVALRVSRASQAFGRLRNTGWNPRGL